MASSTPQLQTRSGRHHFWGSFATPSALPNAVGNALTGSRFNALEAGDVAYVESVLMSYVCTDPGADNIGDAVWSALGPRVDVQLLGGITANDHYVGSAGTQRGDATAFTVCAAVMLRRTPTGYECVVGNYDGFSGNGGWMLGFDANGWRFGVGQQSDGTVVFSGAGADLSSTLALGRITHLALTYTSGTGLATLYVNGQAQMTLTPTGGFQVAAVGLAPFIGRNTQATNILADGDVLGWGYDESLWSAADIAEHVLAVREADAFVDAAAGFTNLYAFAGEETAPATLADQLGGLDMTRVGAPTVSSSKPIW